jgi:hypothetical protein
VGGQFQYDPARALTSGPTAIPDTKTAARLDRLRLELRTTSAARSRADIERLLAMAHHVDQRDSDLKTEIEELRAELEQLRLSDDISREGVPIVDPVEPLPAGERCHFVTPVRFGRRRTDQSGRLELTSERLRFLGALDIGVAWTEVSAVSRDGRTIVIALMDSPRVLRFCCESTRESARGSTISARLAGGTVGTAC